MVVLIALTEGFKNVSLVNLRKIENRNACPRDNLVTGQYHHPPDQGPEVLPRCRKILKGCSWCLCRLKLESKAQPMWCALESNKLTGPNGLIQNFHFDLPDCPGGGAAEIVSRCPGPRKHPYLLIPLRARNISSIKSLRYGILVHDRRSKLKIGSGSCASLQRLKSSAFEQYELLGPIALATEVVK